MLIPENLLRFNCQIIISECRNFNRVKKSLATGNLEVIKDNLSRYVYSLRECQFYFDKMPHDDQIDLSQPKTYDNVSVQFDYKYSAMKFERFVPQGNSGHGKYVGYDSGAIWKIGNPGERDNRGTQSGGSKSDSSVPKFYTEGANKYNQNGVTTPIVIKVPNRQEVPIIPPQPVEEPIEETPQTPGEEGSGNLENFKQNSKEFAKGASERATNAAVASTKAELAIVRGKAKRSLLGLLGKVTGLNGMSPPKNIYTDKLSQTAVGRVFYDVRGELINFAGESMGNFLSNY
jgi:hypothetical protein